jgi:hypothetical protein
MLFPSQIQNDQETDAPITNTNAVTVPAGKTPVFLGAYALPPDIWRVLQSRGESVADQQESACPGL